MAAPNNLSPTISDFNEQRWAILAISDRAGNGALFGMEQDDVIAGIRFAKTLPRIDRNRVGVVGGSHGGHLALVAAEKMESEFLCVAAGASWMTDPVVYMMGDTVSQIREGKVSHCDSHDSDQIDKCDSCVSNAFMIREDRWNVKWLPLQDCQFFCA